VPLGDLRGHGTTGVRRQAIGDAADAALHVAAKVTDYVGDTQISCVRREALGRSIEHADQMEIAAGEVGDSRCGR
jgi:hypothetical protein